ncbi:hypothetical protein Kpol_282p2 [Vanderwaltozyma polyspora DSM 70294]|uniref:K Homology domain-containing protein n=1 Tax=Vanderwaltozyma polyspora (strain ATCC 22028 / DSM 70294 / BCRC 21397 / CBS 2163 / NBRC 10782 / NRRL Y-8283 / UCD 57-17) TaxID=436907 RepID=A7TSS8_VANPO|nr:uncharacterized protein Kpol_282p2 [Vanderwaltozyma polyspora DSM 70294]EDO14675.1 hypothetical protein Kpol_282p2 [Vanderwaltozyma polyspora DSM 70294]
MSLSFENKEDSPAAAAASSTSSSIEETATLTGTTVDDSVDETSTSTVSSTVTPAKLPSLKDLPQLGSSYAFTNTKVNWGPNVKPSVQPTANSVSPSPSPSLSNSKPMRSNVIQEAFTLDLQTQLSMTRPEFAKIIQSVKQNHKVSLESTLSKSSRTFLVSGKREDVQAARRELVKKMTKPITQVFEIPSRCRAAIIGSGGKTIREISNEFEVKIDVAKDIKEGSYDKELDDNYAEVTLHGDVASVNLAKNRILDIVKEETKNSVVKFNVDNEKILGYVDLSEFINRNDDSIKIQYFERSGDIIISGLRELVGSARKDIESYLSKLSNNLVEESVKIPAKFQLLINANEINDKFNVTVVFPTDSSSEFVTFIGQQDKVSEAIAYARSSSKDFAVDSLDISKSHGKNLDHARQLSLFFKKYDSFKSINQEYPEIQIHLPAPAIMNAANDVTFTITARSSQVSDIKSVRKEIINLVNNITPLDTLTVDDLDYDLFHKDIKHILLGEAENAGFIQMGDYFSGNDSLVLFALSSNDDFKPSTEEVLETLKKVNSSLDPLRQKQNSLESVTVDFESDSQDALLAKGKPTLELLLEDVAQEDGNVQIKLHKPNKDQLLVRGNEKAVKIVKKALASITESPSDKSKLAFEIPSNTVSRLVGNKGSNLQQIREKFDCSVNVPNVSENSSKDTTVEITLTGLSYNLDHAKHYIMAEAKKWADIVTKEMIIPAKFHRNMIGSQGLYRNRLQDKYNVRIIFPKSGDIVTVRGPSRGVNKAVDEMKALLDFEIENGHKTIIKVPTDHVARVIGKSGETINDIRADFGVELDFLQNANDEEAAKNGFVELEITGTRAGIKDATARVESIVSEASDFITETLDVDRKYHKFIVGAGGQNLREIISKAGGDEIRNKSVQLPNNDSEETKITVQGPKKFVQTVVKQIQQTVSDIDNRVTKELDIPTERQGALIGPGGIIRHQLESEFNISLDVPNKGEVGKVKISGLSENIDKAEKKIMNEIIRDNFDVELQVPASVHEFVSERGAFIQKLRFDQYVGIRHGNSNRRANKLSRTELVIPVEKASGAGSDEKIKITIEEASLPHASEEGTIPWRLSYEPIDSTGLFDDEENKEEKKEEKDVKALKEEAIKKATKLIEDRIALAEKANFVAYIWSSDARKFNKIVGPGGSNVKKIRENTGTIINVPKRSDKVNDIIYVRGTKEGVEKAAESIVKSLK